MTQVAEERLFFTADHSRLVYEDDPAASTLAVGIGMNVPTEVEPLYQKWLEEDESEPKSTGEVPSIAADSEPTPRGRRAASPATATGQDGSQEPEQGQGAEEVAGDAPVDNDDDDSEAAVRARAAAKQPGASANK